MSDWQRVKEEGGIDNFQFKRSEQSLQGVLYFLGSLIPTPEESASYALIGAMENADVTLAHMHELILREQGWRTEFLGGDLNEKGYLRAVDLLKPKRLSLALRDSQNQPKELLDLCESKKIEFEFI